MTPQEKDLVTTLLTRLRNTASQPKDPEADGLIRQAVAEQPDMPYYLTQTVLIQDLSLHQAQQRIADLERQLTDAQQQAAQPAHTSFLGSLFGSRQPQPSAPPSSGSVPAAGPWARAPQVAAAPPAQPYGQPYAQQPGYGPQGGPGPQGGYGPQGGGGFMGGGGAGGGFLRSAAATAAGVAGGALLFQGIESLFGSHAGAGIMGNQAGMTPGLGESVVNNYYGDAGAGQGGDQDFSGGQDSGGFDPSGGQDNAGGSFDPSGGGWDGGQDYSSDQDFSGGGDFGGDNNQC